jgi:hypothetical protein
VDERRLYEVGPAGGAWTVAEDPAARERRWSRLRRLFAIALGVNALTWTLAGLALVLGGRSWGAAFGVLALLSAPLLALPAAIEAMARLAARRRHVRRPQAW